MRPAVVAARYLCPIDGFVVTLGQTGVQLDRPMQLVWQPGEFGRWHLTEPGQYDAKRLARVTGRILGPGCVVSDHFEPDHERPTGWEKQAGLRLVDAVPTVQDLTERAVEHGDEHAMKYTEACMREYMIRPDPRYLLAADQMLGRIPRYYRGKLG
ncbi:hypothetical protein ABZW18_21305 [Streptomyces sp. NPDC004647]|uniref:hypothetical protein n=1 Tax=Streptomyces sp. NPDC004647 TaxID=3154671 RepID=UPI0033A63DDE